MKEIAGCTIMEGLVHEPDLQALEEVLEEASLRSFGSTADGLSWVAPVYQAKEGIYSYGGPAVNKLKFLIPDVTSLVNSFNPTFVITHAFIRQLPLIGQAFHLAPPKTRATVLLPFGKYVDGSICVGYTKRRTTVSPSDILCIPGNVPFSVKPHTGRQYLLYCVDAKEEKKQLVFRKVKKPTPLPLTTTTISVFEKVCPHCEEPLGEDPGCEDYDFCRTCGYEVIR